MVAKRSEIEEKYKWDLTTIFPTDDAWQVEYDAVCQELSKAKAFEGVLGLSADNLLNGTELYLDLSRRVEKLYVYASMKNDQDTAEAQYQEMESKASALFANFSESFAYFRPEAMAMSHFTFENFQEAQPKLKDYTHFFDMLFLKKEHVLTTAEEALLSKAGEIFGASQETFAVFNNADIQLPKVFNDEGVEIQLTTGNYVSLMESKNREVRIGAYEALYEYYKKYQHTYAKILETNVKTHNYLADVHHYNSARQAALSEDFIPETVFSTLVERVNAHLPLLHRYVNLRKKMLGIEDLKMYDMYTPLSDLDTKYTYEEGQAKALEALAILGDDYIADVKRAFDERWIDVQESAGKRGGAYSGGAYDTNAFILLNWHDTLDNLFTLVHEMGHSMHSTLTRRHQPYVYGDYSIFLAEIASTTNENVLTESLLKDETDPKVRFAILNHYLDGFRGTVFRQTQFAEFEHAIHKAQAAGTVLTSDYMNTLYGDLNAKYYGLDASENAPIQYEWARIPHFYYNYYVFQYATGFAAASYFGDRIVHGTQEDIDKYLNYLKSGSSEFPLEIMAEAGVDMTTGDYLDAAFKVFEDRLNELESLVDQI
jgi:oligoendopeptidase F